MAKAKKRKIVDFENLDKEFERLLAEGYEKGALSVWNKDQSDTAPLISPESEAGKKSPQERKAFLRVLANQSYTGKSAKARKAIKEAREWYESTTTWANMAERNKLEERRARQEDDRLPAAAPPTEEEPSVEGMATEAGKALAVDFALARGIKEITPGKKVGPTRKAKKTQDALKRLENVRTPDVGSLGWAKQRERDIKEQERIEQEKYAMENKLAAQRARAERNRRSGSGLGDLFTGPGKGGGKGKQKAGGTVAGALVQQYGEYGYKPPKPKPRPKGQKDDRAKMPKGSKPKLGQASSEEMARMRSLGGQPYEAPEDSALARGTREKERTEFAVGLAAAIGMTGLGGGKLTPKAQKVGSGGVKEIPKTAPPREKIGGGKPDPLDVAIDSLMPKATVPKPAPVTPRIPAAKPPPEPLPAKPGGRVNPGRRGGKMRSKPAPPPKVPAKGKIRSKPRKPPKKYIGGGL